MPKLFSSDFVLFQVRLLRPVRVRLEHHARRLGFDMTDIIREAVHQHLDALDEKELISEEIRRAKAKKKPFDDHPWGRAPGLGIRRAESKPVPMPRISKPSVPEKLQRSFRRWAEYIEDAEDRSDGERRVQVVLEDIKERTTTEAEVQACYEKFQDFLKERRESKHEPKKLDVVDVESLRNVAGDV